MKMKSWAEREVEIFKKSNTVENPRDDYSSACCDSALKAFESLCDDGHSGFSIIVTKSILNRLIDNKPLTAIEDKDFFINNNLPLSWSKEMGYREWQCPRMSSLFRRDTDGVITYHDNDRCIGVDINNTSATYQNGFLTELLNEYFPITMPYYPLNKPYKIYTEDFLTEKGHGDFDTRAYFYILTPNGDKVIINRFFKEVEVENIEEYKYSSYHPTVWKEITEDEYNIRKNNRVNK